MKSYLMITKMLLALFAVATGLLIQKLREYYFVEFKIEIEVLIYFAAGIAACALIEYFALKFIKTETHINWRKGGASIEFWVKMLMAVVFYAIAYTKYKGGVMGISPQITLSIITFVAISVASEALRSIRDVSK